MVGKKWDNVNRTVVRGSLTERNLARMCAQKRAFLLPARSQLQKDNSYCHGYRRLAGKSAQTRHVPAVPLRVGSASFDIDPPSRISSSHLGEDPTPGTVEPLRVSLVEPVAYQFQLKSHCHTAVKSNGFTLNLWATKAQHVAEGLAGR